MDQPRPEAFSASAAAKDKLVGFIGVLGTLLISLLVSGLKGLFAPTLRVHVTVCNVKCPTVVQSPCA